jgi:2-phospho-L-lactate guanylyltransferase
LIEQAMNTIAVIPVKRFDEAKERLAGPVDAETRARLAQAMLEDVLASLDDSRMIFGRIVVTSDEAAASIARSHGCQVVDDSGSVGHSEAAAIGTEAAIESGAERVLLLAGDCPLLNPREIDHLLTSAPDEGVAIVRDRHGTGTNALLISPPKAIEPAFGEGSAQRHRRIAREKGVLASFEDLPSLALDIDEPADLVALTLKLEAGASGGPRTARVLGV